MTDTVRVPREPTEEMLDAGDAPFHAALQSQREANRRAGRPLDAYGSEPVTRAVWSAMLAASPQGEGSSGEWITHDGGPNPVPGKMVSARYRHGCTMFSTVGASEAVWWDAVIAYRVTEGVKP